MIFSFFSAVWALLLALGGFVIKGAGNQMAVIASDTYYKAVALATTLIIAGAFVAAVVALAGVVYSWVSIPVQLRAMINMLVPPHLASDLVALATVRFYMTLYRFGKRSVFLVGATKL